MICIPKMLITRVQLCQIEVFIQRFLIEDLTILLVVLLYNIYYT